MGNFCTYGCVPWAEIANAAGVELWSGRRERSPDRSRLINNETRIQRCGGIGGAGSVAQGIQGTGACRVGAIPGITRAIAVGVPGTDYRTIWKSRSLSGTEWGSVSCGPPAFI